nr:hypothetical protein [Neokomagataea tanensis]
MDFEQYSLSSYDLSQSAALKELTKGSIHAQGVALLHGQAEVRG